MILSVKFSNLYFIVKDWLQKINCLYIAYSLLILQLLHSFTYTCFINTYFDELNNLYQCIILFTIDINLSLFGKFLLSLIRSCKRALISITTTIFLIEFAIHFFQYQAINHKVRISISSKYYTILNKHNLVVIKEWTLYFTKRHY